MKNLSILLNIFLLVSCASTKFDRYEQVYPEISMEQAIEIAIEYVNINFGSDKVLVDSVKVWEWPHNIKHWYVTFKKSNWKQIKPPTVLIMVNKLTGAVEHLPLK